MLNVKTVLALALLALTSCASVHERIQGQWTLDTEAIGGTDGMPEQMRRALAQMEVHIGPSDMVLKNLPGDRLNDLTYTVVDESGDTITILARERGQEDEDELVLELSDDDNKLRGGREGQSPLLLKRVQAAEEESAPEKK